jgi:hypothetical protein
MVGIAKNLSKESIVLKGRPSMPPWIYGHGAFSSWQISSNGIFRPDLPSLKVS